MALTVRTGEAGRPYPGELRSGDAVYVRASRVSEQFVAVVLDALGHGDAAAKVADRAIATLRAMPDGTSVEQIIDRLDAALHGTRGAAGLICTLDGGRLRGASVGNVEIVVFGTKVATLATDGILGRKTRRLRVFEETLRAGDRFIVFTDGILRDAVHRSAASLRGSPRDVAARIVAEGARATDDATVLICDLTNEVENDLVRGSTSGAPPN
jgi:phosphoserine phosphatase RsbX